MDGTLAISPPRAATTAAGRLPDWVPRRLLTADETLRMVEAGVLAEGERVELIEGQLVVMSPHTMPHMACIGALTEMFVKRASDAAVVWVQLPLRLDAHNVPEPDFALLRRRADGYRRGEPASASDALLVVEVAHSSLRYDRGLKAELYGAFGAPEYWVVDTVGRAVLVHREPGANGYRSVVAERDGATLRPALLSGVQLDVTEILGPTE
jgi:Uma2 family endonuclease